MDASDELTVATNRPEELNAVFRVIQTELQLLKEKVGELEIRNSPTQDGTPIMEDTGSSSSSDDLAERRAVLSHLESHSNRLNELLKNTLPEPIVEQLQFDFRKEAGPLMEQVPLLVSEYKQVTCIFIDVTNFRPKSPARESVSFLHRVFSKMDEMCSEFSCEKIKTIGSCWFGVVGIPQYVQEHASLAVRFALKLLSWAEEDDEEIISLRIGVSSGNAAAAFVGKRKRCYDVFGEAVNMASVMEKYGLPNKISLSRSSYEYTFDMFRFLERVLTIQGKGPVNTYVLV